MVVISVCGDDDESKKDLGHSCSALPPQNPYTQPVEYAAVDTRNLDKGADGLQFQFYLGLLEGGLNDRLLDSTRPVKLCSHPGWAGSSNTHGALYVADLFRSCGKKYCCCLGVFQILTVHFFKNDMRFIDDQNNLMLPQKF